MSAARKPRKARGKVKTTDVGAAEFKARCLELVDHVRDGEAEYIVTRHGTPVARLAPVETRPPASIIGCLRGSVLRFDKPLDPVAAEWSIDRPDGDD